MVPRIRLTTKLVLLLLVFGLVPMSIVGAIAHRSASQVSERIGTEFESAAQTIADKIDRNLFERYGDVQAFALNRVIRDRQQWYKPSTDLVETMNQYVDTYDIYYLTLLVDLEGRLIAVNDRDADGSLIATHALYGRDFSDREWFKALRRGEYTTRMRFSAAANTTSDGSYIEDLHVDGEATESHGDDGLAIGFSAPVYENGEVVAYWSNRTKFALVEDIFVAAYADLDQLGFGSAELMLLDSQGRVIIDYDLEASATHNVRHDFDVLMKLDLVAEGVEAAAHALNGQHGHGESYHTRKQIDQVIGYAPLHGALGYPGMNWYVLVRVEKSEATAAAIETQREIFVSVGAAALAILLFGFLIGRQSTRHIQRIVTTMSGFSAGAADARLPVDRRDELGDLAVAYNGMAAQIAETQASLASSLQDSAVRAGIAENAPINILMADREFIITYVNPQSLRTLHEIEDVLPCAADEVLGKSVDFFHRHPEHQRGILNDPANLPHRAVFPLGHHTIDLLASPLFDENGDYVGPMVTWQVITEKVRLASEVLGAADSVASAAEELSVSARQLATGGEQQKVSVESAASAIQQLAASARSEAENTDGLARLVTETSAALNELAASIVSVTQNAEQMSQTVITNSSAIEELGASIQSQADNAERANASTGEANRRAVEGADVVRQAIEGMERIAQRVRTSSERISDLGRSSEQVSTIVAVINDIADQTNLLALNAAIEAARAGEQGRGFAVVADEVRKLAERTSQATGEIDEMITRIQQDTREVVESMDEGMLDVERGAELSTKSGEALEEIGTGVEQVDQLMGQLTISSREQALMSDQIVQMTAEMNDLVQQVTRAMGEQSQAVDLVSRSSEEMLERVEQVKGSVAEQRIAAERVAGNMEEVNEVAQTSREAAREMDQATDNLEKQADELKGLVTSEQEDDAISA